jgi:shikimate dehydrogenase
MRFGLREDDMAQSPVTSLEEAGGRAANSDIRVGLIGRGISLSRTPKMHMDEGAELGLSYRYDLIDAATMDGAPEIGELLDQAERSGFSGVNITYPFKQAAIAHLDVLSDAAQTVEAVNTVVFRDGKRFGHNTDYWGFTQAFMRRLGAAKTDRVLLLGAGGAGGALASALIDLGVGHLAIYDTATSAAEFLEQRLSHHYDAQRVSIAHDLEAEIEKADGVVNATPVGMVSLPGSPVPCALLDARHWVADIIYFPLETELLAAARAAGCQTMDGSGMAVFQAVRAFELFSGVKPDPERMRATFDAFS